MRILRNFTEGADVKAWQAFLTAQGFDTRGTDGRFGDNTERATRGFQAKAGVAQTGMLDDATLAAALARGFRVLRDVPADAAKEDWPAPLPGLEPLVSNEQRARVFGAFAYVHEPLPKNAENIRITDGWDARNIIPVDLPQLRFVANRTRVSFHRLAAAQLQALWEDWETAGLLDRVLSWGGSFVPRFVRGSTETLSNHAFGSAFDINMAWNPLDAVPAGVGETGCVRELVGLANKRGFWWGGHFKRRDGMHFEIARLL